MLDAWGSEGGEGQNLEEKPKLVPPKIVPLWVPPQNLCLLGLPQHNPPENHIIKVCPILPFCSDSPQLPAEPPGVPRILPPRAGRQQEQRVHGVL